MRIKGITYTPIDELTDKYETYYLKIECVDGRTFYADITTAGARQLATNLLAWCDEVEQS